MAVSDVRIDQPGQKVLMLGNEAMARGALEAGVDIVACYPGTPSSEVSDTLAELAEEFGFYMEYSTNEKVALEVAAGAALIGARGMAIMKYAGLNVALDTLVGSAYLGTAGGLVLVVCDDPSAHSSAGEQDTRLLAEGAYVPTLVPSDPAEAKAMVKDAFDISETLGTAVMVRSVTRVSHASGVVELGEIPSRNERKFFWDKKAIQEENRYTIAGSPTVMPKRAKMLARTQKAKELFESSPYNQVSGGGGGVGILTCGVTHNYALEALDILGLEASVFKVGTCFPLPEKKLSDFLGSVEKLIVLEELEPFLELRMKALANRVHPGLEVFGKENGFFPLVGEYNTPVVIKGLCRALGLEPPLDYARLEREAREAMAILPPRTPVYCAGCPHAASMWAIGQATRGKTVACPGDIGCYTLGFLPPHNMHDTTFAMGASAGIACGLSHVLEQPIIAIIGDSTFLHAGMPALVNAVYNQADFTLLILDNGATGMTGFQPHPGTGVRAGNKLGKRVLLEEVCRGFGVDDVKVMDPYRVGETIEAIKDSLAHPGPSVVICRQPCVVLQTRERRKTGEAVVPYVVESDRCNGCFLCTRRFGCPAISQEDKLAVINPQMCVGCGVCAQLCPTEAIVRQEAAVG